MSRQTKLELARLSDPSTGDIAIFEQNKPELSLPQMVQAEINTLSLPYAVLHEKEAKTSPGHELIRFEKQGSSQIVWQWRVTPDRDHGMPTMFTMRVLFGLMEIAQEAKQKFGEIPERLEIGSLNSFCKRIGLVAHREWRNLIKRHIRILVCTSCISKGAFKTKQGTGLALDHFSYLRTARFIGQRDDDDNIIESNFVVFDHVFKRNLEANYIKAIDVAFMRELKSPIAQLLYTHLSHLFNELNGWTYADPDYTWLAERMGLKIYGELKRARQQFKQAIAELIEFNYLAKAEWNGWKIRFYPGVRYTYGEAAPRLERKKQIRNSRQDNSNCKVQSEEKPISATPTPEEERETVLIRQATRLMLGQKPDEQLLLENGWTVQDATSKMFEIKNQL